MDSNQVRVLLVEDDPDDYYLTKDLLAEIPGSKITLEWARDFESGLHALGRCEHDVYLLDYRLGKSDGLALLREGLRHGCKAPVILITGQQDRELALQALEAGAADYLVKGQIDAGALERSIRYALQQKRLEVELARKVAERTAELERTNAALRESESAVRESEARIRALFESAEAARISAESAKLRAEAATRAKDDFLAALSHELRTPLSPALLLATSLADDASLSESVRQDIDSIAKGIALQAQLVDDLLDITRISGGKLRLDLHPIDAHAALKHAFEIVRTEAKEREIAFTFDLTAPRYCIRADAVRVQQIFWNVLKNAVKFTPPGGAVTVRTRSSESETLEVEVTDSGIGIEPQVIGKIFDAFIQEEHDRTHRFGGIGLGLAITRRLVELQSGRITVQSAGRNSGSTFRIELPLEKEQVCTSAEPAPRRAIRSEIARQILLVEDHEETRVILTRLLDHRGHTVRSVGTAAAAVEAAASGEFDLVISDLGLPDRAGHALMAELREVHGLSGIALSGYGMDEDLTRSRQSGFFAHLTKPVDIRDLDAAIALAPLTRLAPVG